MKNKNFSGNRACKSSWSRRGKPKVIYIDNSMEFGKSCEDLSWDHSTSTSYRSETNGIAERAVRRIKEGTSAVLLQSGLDEEWWADFPWNATAICDVKGCSEYHSTDRLFRLERSKNTLFLLKTSRDSINSVQNSCQAYSLDMRGTWEESGKETSWSPTLRNWNRWTHLNSLKKDFAKEVLTPMNGEKFIFPIADETVTLSGGDQVLRPSTLIGDRPDRGEEEGNLQGESDGSSSALLQDSSWSDGDARNDFWSISGNFIYSHHVESRVNHFLFH